MHTLLGRCMEFIEKIREPMNKILYTRLKAFHFEENLAALPIATDKIAPPIHIRLKPTNICNHRCRYCAYSSETLTAFGKNTWDHNATIPGEKMLEIIGDIIEMGVKAVTFSGGGDPFVYPHLLEASKILAKSPVRFAALTNGSRVTGELAEVFAASATWLRISMDGWDNASYSYYRGVPDGEYTKIMKNIGNFKMLSGRCYLGVSLIIDGENGLHVYESLRRLKDAGVDSVKLSPCLVSDDELKNKEYHLEIASEIKDQIEQAKSDLADSKFELFDAYTTLSEKFQKQYTWCPTMQLCPIIGADQNVYTCPDKAYNLDKGLIGSIKDRRFSSFWFDDKSKFYKVNPTDDCSHHCERNALNELLVEYSSINPEHLYFV